MSIILFKILKFISLSMTEKKIILAKKISFLLIFFIFTGIFFYQIYLIKKIKKEINQIQEIRIYYIQFLNAVTEHLKKKILN
jgi:hypothetical protein